VEQSDSGSHGRILSIHQLSILEESEARWQCSVAAAGQYKLCDVGNAIIRNSAGFELPAQLVI